MQVRVERRGKSSPARGEPRGPVNPIRSNTDWWLGIAHAFAGRYTDGWREQHSNVLRRKMIALNDRTRLTVPLIFFLKGISQLMDEQLIRLSGKVESVIHEDTESGFTVLELETEDGEVFTIVGTHIAPIPGETLTVEGSWTQHHTFGRQFRAETCVHERPKTAADQYSYLASGAIKGVGEGTARRLIEAFGENTFDVIENEPERVASIKGISLKKAKEISKAFKNEFATREIIITLEKYGLSPAESIKLFNAFGATCISTVERNPYIITSEIIGCSFEKAEAVARLLPQKPDEGYRLNAGTINVLRHNLSNGHTCLPVAKLITTAAQYLTVSEGAVTEALENMISKKELVKAQVGGKDFIFLPDAYRAEHRASERLIFMKRFPPAGLPVDDSEIQHAEVIGGLCYNQVQRLAIKTAVESGLLILTGGPGTGKTTTLRAILRLFEERGIDTVLAAPTGRAAKRMSELAGREAKTIHRLLEVEWDKHDRPVFQRNLTNPIECDAIIIDELSMVDVYLFSSLLDALPIGTRIVLVGDSDQLPPVGAGNVLQDLIGTGILPVVELNEVFRQAMNSKIVTNAHRIVHGEMPDITCRDGDFFYLERNTAVAAAFTITELCSTRLPKAYNYSSFEDIQVICPSRLGDTGTVHLNGVLQQALNPPAKHKREYKHGERIFREGDKVMQIKNNYDIAWRSSDGTEGLGVFNGDIGILEKIDFSSGTMKIRFDDRTAEYLFDHLNQLELSYAVTVHKSQGSEFKAVIVPCVGIIDRLAYRNLLYTAVTRAREILIMVGTEKQIKQMVDNNVKTKRYSALRSFLFEEDDR